MSVRVTSRARGLRHLFSPAFDAATVRSVVCLICSARAGAQVSVLLPVQRPAPRTTPSRVTVPWAFQPVPD